MIVACNLWSRIDSTSCSIIKKVTQCIQRLSKVFEATRNDVNSNKRQQHEEEILFLLSECHILPSIKIPFNLTPFSKEIEELELPLHIACAVGCSFGVIQLLYHLFPPALSERSPSRSVGVLLWSDLLPIHYACISGASAKTLSFLIHRYPESRFCQASTGTSGFQRPFNFCFWRDHPLDWKPILHLIGRDTSFTASLESKGDLYFGLTVNVARIQRFIDIIKPNKKDISLFAKTNHTVNHLGVTLDESLAVEDSIVMKIHPRDENWEETLLTLESINVPMRWLEIRTKGDKGTIPRLTRCIHRFLFKESLEQVIIDAVVESEEEMNNFLKALLTEFPNLKSVGLSPRLKWFGLLVHMLEETNCSLHHVVFGPEYPQLRVQVDPLIKKKVDFCCIVNRRGRGIIKNEKSNKEDIMNCILACINDDVSILYGMLRFHPAKWL